MRHDFPDDPNILRTHARTISVTLAALASAAQGWCDIGNLLGRARNHFRAVF